MRVQKREPKEKKVSLARLRKFVDDFKRKKAQKGVHAGRTHQKEANAPVLQPRTFRYRWAA